MTTSARSASRTALVTTALGAAVLTLTGCAGIMNTLHKVHEESFADHAAVAEGWVGVDAPAWIPDDATGIRNLATDDETNSVIYAETDADPVGCEEGDRRGLAFDSPDWAPELDPLPDTVWICGDYEVAAAGDGLLGWFTATEAGQKPNAG